MSASAISIRPRTDVAPERAAPGRARIRRRPSVAASVGEPVIVGASVAAISFAMALYLVAHDALFVDTVSRVANGSFVVFSRDPHLAAVGFVWSPLPSLAAVPLLLLKPVLPALSSLALAGNIESAVCGGAAAGLLDALLAELGLRRRSVRLVLVALFALHPVQLLLFSDGATEAMQLMWMVLAAFGLVRWIRHRAAWDLVLAGVALGLVYLTRYEGAPAAAVATLLVGLISWQRTRGAVLERCLAAVNDMLLAGLPFLLSFGSWALASKVIVGHWFEQFASEYGNSAQAGHAKLAAASPADNAIHVLRQIAYLEPAGAVAVAAAAVVAWRLRRWDLVAPIIVLAPLSVFDFATSTYGVTFSWLRFQAVWIPISVLAAGAVVAGAAGAGRAPALRRGLTVVATVAALALGVLAGLPSLADSAINPEGFGWRQPATATDQFRTQRDIARTLDSLQTGPRDLVLVDASRAFGILLDSHHENRFVTQNDRDFKTVLEDLPAHHVRYILMSSEEPALGGPVARRFPQLYDNGAGFASLMREWTTSQDVTWRLYRVN